MCQKRRTGGRTERRAYERAEFQAGKTGLIVNRAPDGKLDQGTLEEIEKQNLELLGVVPQDEMIYRFDCAGEPLVRLPDDSPVRVALGEIVEKLGL